MTVIGSFIRGIKQEWAATCGSKTMNPASTPYDSITRTQLETAAQKYEAELNAKGHTRGGNTPLGQHYAYMWSLDHCRGNSLGEIRQNAHLKAQKLRCACNIAVAVGIGSGLLRLVATPFPPAIKLALSLVSALGLGLGVGARLNFVPTFQKLSDRELIEWGDRITSAAAPPASPPQLDPLDSLSPQEARALAKRLLEKADRDEHPPAIERSGSQLTVAGVNVPVNRQSTD